MDLILIKQFFYKFIIRYVPSLLFKFQHYRLHKKFIRKSSFSKSNAYVPNLNNPKTFNEYILNSKHNILISKYYKFVDKFLVKDYVRNIIDEKHIIPTQKYYTSEQKVNVDDLSFPCIIKPTHLSGYLLRLNDKSDFNKKTIQKFINIFIIILMRFFDGFAKTLVSSIFFQIFKRVDWHFLNPFIYQ